MPRPRRELPPRAEHREENAAPRRMAAPPPTSAPAHAAASADLREAAPTRAAASADVREAAPAVPSSRWALWFRRARRTPAVLAGLAIVACLLLLAAVGEPLARAVHGWTFESTDFTALSDPPGPTHWFGATAVGGDVFAQVCHGLARSLLLGVVASLGVTVIAALVGAGAGYAGGWVERVALAVVHLLLVVPGFVLLALVATAAGGGWGMLLLALVATGWMTQARVVWSMAASLRERHYITAARELGVRGSAIVVRHLLPNLASYLLFCFATGVVAAVSAETTLAFLGIGAATGSLGRMLADGSRSFASAPWLFAFPALLLTLLTVGMALLADGLRAAMDPASGRAS